MTPETQKARAEAYRRQAEDDLRAALSTATGRRLLWSLIDGRAGALSQTYSGEQTHHAAYLEGRRSVGLELMVACQRADSANYVHMLGEAFQVREQERLAAEKEHDHGG